MSEDFSILLEESISKLQVKSGSIITGTVIDIKKDLVIVNAGLKSEGMIPIDQFIGFDGKVEVQEGDKVEVTVDAIEDGFGETKLSREKAKKARAWVSLSEAFEEKKILASDEQASSFKEIFEKELSIDQKKLFWKLVKKKSSP